MPSLPSSSRFGSFTFDPASGDLHGEASTTRLQPQVAALLAVLIEHAGSVVSRSELQTRLWPDTTVEFDDGLNFCIRQLRIALGDDASAPTYIETLPRRGYRFLMPITRAGEVTALTRPRRSTIGVGAVIIAAAVVLAVLAANHRLPGQRAEGSPMVLAILPFKADAADSMVVAYQRRLYDQLVLDARTERIWDSVADSTPGASYVLGGELRRDGNSVKLFVDLRLGRDGSHLWADELTDLYAFSGNSKMTADKIEKSVARILGDSIVRKPLPPR